MGNKVVGILLMAGMGGRFGSELPKQFHRLAGKKIYQHTLARFLHSKLFDEVLLVCPSAWQSEVEAESAHLPQVRVVCGADTRQGSSYAGLQACGPETDIVVIHDAVRPFVSDAILKENVERARIAGAVDTCIPSADTIVHAPNLSQIESIPVRKEYLRGQTPQSFQHALIVKAHERAIKLGIHDRSDDCALVLSCGHNVQVVLGSEQNIKITTELDLLLAEQIFRLAEGVTPIHAHISLVGKRYAVTGGMGGIGQALCHALQKEGAIAIPIARQDADLSSFTQTQTLFSRLAQEHGPLDGLINSIGALQLGTLDALAAQQIDIQLSANLSAVIYSCKCAHLKPGAHIVNIASSSFARGRKNYAIYAAAKAGVVNFTQGLSEERPELCINAIVPQRTLTPMRLANFPGEPRDSLLAPEEVAAEIVALLRSQLTGTMIEVRKKN